MKHNWIITVYVLGRFNLGVKFHDYISGNYSQQKVKKDEHRRNGQISGEETRQPAKEAVSIICLHRMDFTG